MKSTEFSKVYTPTFCNDTLPTRTLANPIRTTSSLPVITISHPNHNMYSAHQIMLRLLALAQVQVIMAFNGSSINGTYTSISNVTLDSYQVQLQIVQMQHLQVMSSECNCYSK